MKKKASSSSAREGAKAIDAYIAGFPAEVQTKLKKIRSVIRKAAPEAEEAFKYQIPTYVLNGHLIFFAGYKNHVAVYPRTEGMDPLKAEIAPYESGRGTLKFPLTEPIPFELIGRLTAIRVKESAGSAAKKKAAKKPAKAAKKSAKPAAKKRTKLPRR